MAAQREDAAARSADVRLPRACRAATMGRPRSDSIDPSEGRANPGAIPMSVEQRIAATTLGEPRFESPLPLEETIENASAALAEIRKTAASLNVTAGSYSQNAPLYQNLSETLRQLDETLRSLRELSGTLERKPNSIIFGKPGRVPPPKGSDQR